MFVGARVFVKCHPVPLPRGVAEGSSWKGRGRVTNKIITVQGRFQLLPPAPPYHLFPRGKPILG